MSQQKRRNFPKLWGNTSFIFFYRAFYKFLAQLSIQNKVSSVIALYIGFSTTKMEKLSLIQLIVIALYIGLSTLFMEQASWCTSQVIALYIGLSTTGFCVSCIYLSYILSHFLSSVNIFLKKVGRSLFPKSLKSLYLSHFFSFPILMVRPTDFLVPVIFTSVY